MKLSICSFSFHRMLGRGEQDIFRYIRDCKELGCTHLQPWCAHFARGVSLEQILEVGKNPGNPEAPGWLDAPADRAYLRGVRAAAEDAGLAFELVAVDRAAVFQTTPEGREAAHRRAAHWLDAAAELGASGIRVDAGGPADMTDEEFGLIRDGYRALIEYGGSLGVDIYVENHWGSSHKPENIVRFVTDIPGLKYLFDTNNWAVGRQRDGWNRCVRYAQATHVKTFAFDAAGNETSVDLVEPIRLLVDSGYSGVWGVESCPGDGREMEAAAQTIELIRRAVAT